MHKTLLAVSLAAAGSFAGCGATAPLTFCNEFEVEVCARIYECDDAATKASARFDGQLRRLAVGVREQAQVEQLRDGDERQAVRRQLDQVPLGQSRRLR